MPIESPILEDFSHDATTFHLRTELPFTPLTRSTEDSSDVNRPSVAELQSLSNDQLTLHVVQLNRQQQMVNAQFLLYLGELDCRKLYRNLACSSLFDFLMTRLGQSEDVAYRWMWGARLLRSFPLAYELLVSGRIHLTSLMLLKPHLTEENHREWLMVAAGKSKREIEKIVATRRPKPDVPARVRKLPEPAASQRADRGERVLDDGELAEVVRSPAPNKSSHTGDPVDRKVTQSLSGDSSPASIGISSRETKIRPLSEHSYRVVFTASQRMKTKLDRAAELVSHKIPPTDLPMLIERALDLLIVQEERRRYGSPHQLASVALPKRSVASSRTDALVQLDHGEGRDSNDARPSDIAK